MVMTETAAKEFKNIVTMTSDAKFVREASAQGEDFNIYVQSPMPLTER